MSDSATIWEANTTTAAVPGVSEAELAKWEQSNGVRLPEILRTALKIQNGGAIRNSETQAYALDSIVRPEAKYGDDFWDMSIYEEDEWFPDKRLVFFFAEDNSCRPMYLLDFNANGPEGEPAVFNYFYDTGGDIDEESENVGEFFHGLQSADDRPAVDWAEIDGLDTVHFREKLEVNDTEGGKRATESVIGRLDGQLLIYRHEVWGENESLLKLEIAEPLDPEEMLIEKLDYNPPFYSLSIVSADPDDEEEDQNEIRVESHRLPAGTWKNEDLGALNDIESLSREKLEQLRSKLLGEAGVRAADAAQARQDKTEAMIKGMESMSPAERANLQSKMAANILKHAESALDGKDLDFDKMAEEFDDLLGDEAD